MTTRTLRTRPSPRAAIPNATPTQPKKSAQPKNPVDVDSEGIDRYEKFYNKFERPPFAPIFFPTEEEFLDPIQYVAKIRDEAEKYGVVKIVPPVSFKPPFVLNKDEFTFRPRIQRLNEIEAVIKEKATFIERIINYNRLNGYSDYAAVDELGRPLDLYRLHKLVTAYKGFDEVTKKNLWGKIAENMWKLTKTPPATFAPFLKKHYADHLIGFLKNVKDEPKNDVFDNDFEEEDEKHRYQHHHGVKKEEVKTEEEEVEEQQPECSFIMQGRRRMSAGKGKTKRPSGRMMAGLSREEKTPVSAKKTNKKIKKEEERDPMDLVYCSKCRKGDHEDLLLVCEIESCSTGMHTFCCEPPLSVVPEGEWRCPACVKAVDATIGSNWGFYDDQSTSYSINEFSDFANDFKCHYFHVENPTDVSPEKVEAEFWKNVISEQDVVVKYGADLITSEVGSGFPRKGDDHSGHRDSRQREIYADHQWNLNNLPVLEESVLSHIDIGISGMMVPWVYVGMCFSTFCWHTEDHWTYSINYNHWGEPKVWYGIGGDDAELFENTVRKLAPGLSGRQRDLFHHMTTAVNPALLRKQGVPVHMVRQNAGEFVVTFPRAYHAGFNEGVNFAEAVNFAPVDWLSKGRLCVSEYASVRRCCVFSHEELVMKIASSCDTLGISTSLATLDELMEISRREHRLRLMISNHGVKKERRELFEEKNDDFRACRVCKTTVYLSAVTCAHDRIACLQHHKLVCKTCPKSQLQLLYRYDLKELLPFIEKLELRTMHYSEWKSRIDAIVQGDFEADIRQLDELFEQSRKERFPMSANFRAVCAFRTQARSAIEKANKILNGKVRTRVKTRIQRADTRLDLDELIDFIAELRKMPCKLKITIAELEELVQSIKKWQKRAAEVIAEVKKMLFDGTLTTTDEVLKLVESGDNFDIRIPELENLKKASEMKEWQAKASAVLAWDPTTEMEDDPEFENRQRWSTDYVFKLVSDAGRLLDCTSPDGPASRLHSKMRAAIEHDHEAKTFMGEPRIENLQDVWKTVRNSDWCTSKYIDELRLEVLKVCEVHKQLQDATKVHPTTSEFSKSLEILAAKFAESEFSCAVVDGLIGQCEESRVLKESKIYKTLLSIREAVVKFTDRICKLFKPSPSYYNLVEIIGNRDDIAELTEGQLLPRELQTSSSPPNPEEEWHQLNEFDSASAMISHQNMLKAQQEKLFGALQTANSSRSVRETCICAGGDKKLVETPDNVLCCLICRASYHVSCCDWTPVLRDMPAGAFLCVRCLRGRRPYLADVEAACSVAPRKSLEVVLVRESIARTQSASKHVMESISKYQAKNSSPQISKQLRTSILAFLACEVLNNDVMRLVLGVLPAVFGDLIEKQSKAFSTLMSRPARATPIPVLFVVGNGLINERLRGKRSGQSQKEVSKKQRKRSDVYLHEDGQLCDADYCLNPFGNSMSWAQCELGCDRWFHFVCVGRQCSASEPYECPSCTATTSSETEAATSRQSLAV
ncbi:unnamed protein product [Caenorhabditis auriculariae]|uniref:[histone H3]-trimethyl-L-lysine(4) demethylase n=1 Tax=Caenorhabditis auriculariae TaxID=2777116 RepID=A0A8S1HL43_9PELO|nr:unnamed protein product [Caenorhabditis auriculariae]